MWLCGILALGASFSGAFGPEAVRAAPPSAPPLPGETSITLDLGTAPSGRISWTLSGQRRRIAIDVDRTIAAASVPWPNPLGARVRIVHLARRERIVVDLAQPGRVIGSSFAAGGGSYVLRLVGDPPSRAGAKRTVPPAPLPALSDQRPLVVLDAGHGGHDPGAINGATGVREKDATLALARAVRDALLRRGRVAVRLTRNDDRFLMLRDRFAVARRNRAGLLVSIHADASPLETSRGATVYTLSEGASDREAAALAARENRADLIGGADLNGVPRDVSSLLLDIVRRDTLNRSARFAATLAAALPVALPVKQPPLRAASLMVLRAPDVPSVLLEAGYITNADDAARLTSWKGRAAIAETVAGAIEDWLLRQAAPRSMVTTATSVRGAAIASDRSHTRLTQWWTRDAIIDVPTGNRP